MKITVHSEISKNRNQLIFNGNTVNGKSFKTGCRERRLNGVLNVQNCSSRVNVHERSTRNDLENKQKNRERSLNGSKNGTTPFTPPPLFRGGARCEGERSSGEGGM